MKNNTLPYPISQVSSLGVIKQRPHYPSWGTSLSDPSLLTSLQLTCVVSWFSPSTPLSWGYSDQQRKAYNLLTTVVK